MSIQSSNHMGNSPKVSVIMNCLNCEKYLHEAIDSVYSQTYKDWEIIFWDNNSIDKSAEIAKGYDEKLRYFKGNETVPLGMARNLAIKHARGEYIAFLDCDDIWLPQKLQKQIPLFENNHKIGLVYSNTIFFNQQTGKEWSLYKKGNKLKGMVFRELLSHYIFSMETVIISRECLNNQTEWFDERFNMIEEAELFLRIAYKNEVDYVDEPLSKWRIHSENWSLTRHNELLPLEVEQMIKKFCELFDDFGERFKDEIFTLKVRNEYCYGLLEWEKGKKSYFRNHIRPYLWKYKKYLIPYMLSYIFPYSFYYYLCVKTNRVTH
ncbi:Glycosyltransferase AglE [uncultured archaeon]|nr:Glycosyltransferase AglE [uncultured archaeon]